MSAAEYIVSVPREEQDRSGKIRLCPSGRYVNPLDFHGEDVDILDIAHHLAGINRYTGGTPVPYNVAQHSVIVAQYFQHPRMRLAALLHDASEFVLNDMASPVKHDPRMAFYREAEERVQTLIFYRFGVDDLFPAIKPGGAIKAIDDLVFHRETASFWGKTPVAAKDRITPIPALLAERCFLGEFRKIQALL